MCTDLWTTASANTASVASSGQQRRDICRAEENISGCFLLGVVLSEKGKAVRLGIYSNEIEITGLDAMWSLYLHCPSIHLEKKTCLYSLTVSLSNTFFIFLPCIMHRILIKFPLISKCALMSSLKQNCEKSLR